MSCDDKRQLITAYFDGELDLEGTLDIERHIGQCPACARSLAAQRALRDSIRAAGLRYEPTPAQTSRLRDALRRAARDSGAGAASSGAAGGTWQHLRDLAGGWSWQRLEAVAAVLLVALVSFTLGRALPPRAAGPSPALAQEVVSSHVRSLLAGHPADVISSDRHTVKPWFTGKLDYAPQVLDLAAQGFPLAGGRLDYLDRHPVAALVYRAGPHTINLFTWPATTAPPIPPTATTERGFHLLHWTQSGMTYWAVSDASPDRLNDFARRLRAELARSGP
jgi:anti-sigma factor RsiW